MDAQTLCQKIKQQFDSLPKQVRAAASFVLDHPQEVAVMSMREQARLAGLPPSTMTRLAKHLGLAGYDAVRDAFIDALRQQDRPAYGGRVPGLVALNQQFGEETLVAQMAENAVAHVRSLTTPEGIAGIVRAAHLLAAARRIYALGLRSSFSVAYQFAYVTRFFADNVRLVDGAGESEAMAMLRAAGPRDVLFVASIAPYARRAVSVASFLAKRGVRIVAVTDSASSPLARLAEATVLVGKENPSFFDTVTPAFLLSEILAALMAAGGRKDVETAVSETEDALWRLDEWWPE